MNYELCIDWGDRSDIRLPGDRIDKFPNDKFGPRVPSVSHSWSLHSVTCSYCHSARHYSMACYRLSLLKSLASGLSSSVSRSSAQSCRALSHSSTLSKSVTIRDNIVYSPFPDCQINEHSVTQHFFGLASRWPSHVAVVAIPNRYLHYFIRNQ